MIIALLLGREGSVAFPMKNVYPVMGRLLMEYPLIAAKSSRFIDEIYISTDSEKIKEVGRKYGAYIIERPSYLCTKEALGEDAFVHGYKFIRYEAKRDVELLVLLFCNAATITSEIIDKGVEILRQELSLDSAVTVSRYNMWSPLRARREDEGGLLKPFVPFECFGDPKAMNCDRDSQGDVWFADMGASIVRPRCLENIEDGLPPQKWMGQRIYPLKQWGGHDVDYEWQIPMTEYWLLKHRFTDTKTPYE